MRRAAKLLAVLAAASCLATRAGAASLTLTLTSPPAAYKPGGRAINVLGITPGMTSDAARKVLEKEYGTVFVNQDNLGLADRGASVATQTFVNRMSANKGADQITVWFGTPTTGNGVVEVTRQVSYPSEADAPTLDKVRSDLIADYGKPGTDDRVFNTGEVQLLAWSFKGDKPSACLQASCRADLSEGLDVRNIPAYARAVKAGHELTVVAILLAGISDPSHAAGIVVTMSDAATKMKSLESAITQMRTALGGRHAGDDKKSTAQP